MIYAGKTLEISREFRNKTFQSAKWIALENFSLTQAKARNGRDAGDPWDSTEQRNAGILAGKTAESIYKFRNKPSNQQNGLHWKIFP